MKNITLSMTTTHRALAALALMAVASLLAFTAYAATAPELSVTETVANVSTGTNNQATATSSSQANVAEVKATRTITVTGNFNGTVNASSVSLTIGTCVITIAASPGADTDCSNNTAAVATTTNTTAAAIAGAIRSVTNISDTGHGALTVGGSSATASFTTTGTEASATAVTATLSAGTDITLTTVNTTGVIPVAQVFTYTPSNVEIGDIFTAIINGTTVSYTATAATVANVTAGLTTAINASAVASAVTASDQTTRIDVTSDTAGTSFTLTKGATNRAAVAQQVTFTPTGLSDATYTIILDGVSYDYDAAAGGSSAQQIVEGLDAASAGSATVSCSEDNVTLTCVAASAGTSFTYSWSSSGFSGGGGGGGSSHHSGGGGGSSNDDDDDDTDTSTDSGTDTSAGADVSARASLMAKIAELQAMLAAITGGTPAPDAAASGFSRDLDVGSEGADVTALQNWLIGKGYAIEAGATGYFGAQTQTALAAYQKAMGIEPAVGFFGPKTRASIK